MQPPATLFQPIPAHTVRLVRLASMACLAMALQAGGPAGGSDAGPTALPAEVAAQVGDTPIFRTELDAAMSRVAQGRHLEPEQRARLEAETIEQLVDERLLRREIETSGVVVDEDDVTELITRMRGQLADRKIPLDAFLAKSGRDETSLRSQLRLEIGLNKLLVPQVTRAALEAAYVKHHRELDGTMIRVSHIVLRPDPGRGAEALADLQTRAATLRTEILQGELGFAEAARRHSAGPSRRQGGDLGYFPRHGVMDEDFSRESFALAKGEVSKPFATAFGVHLVLVTDLRPGAVGADVLRAQLEKLVMQQAIRDIVTRGREAEPVRYAPGITHFASDSDRDRPGRRVMDRTLP